MKIFGIGKLTDNIHSVLSELEVSAKGKIVRQFPLDLRVRYRELSNPSKWIQARSLFLSEESVHIETSAMLRLDSEIDLEIEFSENEKSRVLGRVFWGRRTAETPDRYECGINFLNPLFVKSSVPEKLYRFLGSKLPFKFERRGTPRVQINVPVKFKVKSGLLFWKKASTKDLSENGVKLDVPVLIPVDTEIELEIKPPQKEKMKVSGRVVWTRQVQGQDSYECGVAFFKQTSAKEKLATFMAEKLFNFIGQHGKKLECRPVADYQELKEVYALTYREYLRRGYCSQNEAKMHYTYYSLLPDSKAFVLRRKGRLMGTITLIPDSDCGVPMETLFPKEIDAIRGPKRRLAEVSLLSLNQDLINRGSFSLTNLEKMSCLFSLFKTLFDYARFIAGITDIVMCMHPKHVTLYRYLSFCAFGPVRSYPGACNKPALPMRMDIIEMMGRRALNEAGNFFLGSAISKRVLDKHLRLTALENRQLLFDNLKLWGSMPESAKSHFRKVYKGIDS